jgi:RND family efflux transporter MFP subunit
VNGIVDAVHFKEGDLVDDKKVLVEIDVEKFRLSVARAEAELARFQAQETLARTLHDNRLKLYEEGRKREKEWVTEEQMAQWRADLAKAKADVARATADVDLAKREHARSQVRSPIAGLLNRKSVAKGEYVKVDTIIATILNVSTLHVRFSVPELEASRLTIGQEVEFRSRSASETLFKAKLFYMGQKADVSTRALECKAEIAGDPKLRPGFFAEVTLKTGARQGVVIPERCVLPSDRGFLAYVVVEGKAKQKLVKLGLRTKDGVEVTDGLAAGDKVAADGAASLKDGMEVDVVTEGGKK